VGDGPQFLIGDMDHIATIGVVPARIEVEFSA